MIRHTIWNEDINMEDWVDDMPEIDPEQFGDMSREDLLNDSAAYDRAMEENYRYTRLMAASSSPHRTTHVSGTPLNS